MLGLSAETLDADPARQLSTSERRSVVITGVAPGSIGDLAGMQPGDIIVEADRKPVASVGGAAIHPGTPQQLLLIRRGEGSIFLALGLK